MQLSYFGSRSKLNMLTKQVGAYSGLAGFLGGGGGLEGSGGQDFKMCSSNGGAMQLACSI